MSVRVRKSTSPSLHSHNQLSHTHSSHGLFPLGRQPNQGNTQDPYLALATILRHRFIVGKLFLIANNVIIHKDEIFGKHELIGTSLLKFTMPVFWLHKVTIKSSMT